MGWANSRDNALGESIAEKGYVAAKPLDLRVLSALKAKGSFVSPLVAAMKDREEVIAQEARAGSCALQDGDCGIRGTNGKRPSDPEELALFLFVTRQQDAFFNLEKSSWK